METTACFGFSLKRSSTMKPTQSKCLASKKKEIIYVQTTFGTNCDKSVSNSSFSYFFRTRLHRQPFDSCTSTNSTLPLSSAVLVELLAAKQTREPIEVKNKPAFCFVLFLRITFQLRSDPQSIVQLYKQLYQHKVPELLIVIPVPKANVYIPSSTLISQLL